MHGVSGKNGKVIIGFLFYLNPGTDWVDPEDPTVIAENELLTAASSIEAAAKKLSQLKPRPERKVSVLCLFHQIMALTLCDHYK